MMLPGNTKCFQLPGVFTVLKIMALHINSLSRTGVEEHVLEEI